MLQRIARRLGRECHADKRGTKAQDAEAKVRQNSDHSTANEQTSAQRIPASIPGTENGPDTEEHKGTRTNQVFQKVLSLRA